jgi:hypothetical protein
LTTASAGTGFDAHKFSFIFWKGIGDKLHVMINKNDLHHFKVQLRWAGLMTAELAASAPSSGPADEGGREGAGQDAEDGEGEGGEEEEEEEEADT